MNRFLFSMGLAAACVITKPLLSHCQMPCGIYHDDMVYDQVDQYVETMAKGISILTDSKFSTVRDKNEFIRWVYLKEIESDKIANLITTYFLQQKIKPGEEDTSKRVLSAHRLLFYLVAIKQFADLKYLNDFYEEWEKFKLMFHIEGYACKMEQLKLKKWRENQKQAQQDGKQPEQSGEHDHDHDHDHEHGHEHEKKPVK